MDKLEAIRIDLADYEYAGEGANGMSFNHRRDPDVMLKLYRPLRDIEAEVRPFAGLKTIIVERDMGRPMPTFREALKPILQP